MRVHQFVHGSHHGGCKAALGACQVQLRPQPGNGQDYFGVLRRWAGREQWGMPVGLGTSKGSCAKWAHREIHSLAMMGDPVGIGRQSGLFRQWLEDRNLHFLVETYPDAPQFADLGQSQPRLSIAHSVYHRLILGVDALGDGAHVM